MFFKLVTRHSPTIWGIDIAEQPQCLLIYAVHAGAVKSMDTTVLAVWRLPALHLALDPELFWRM